MTSPLSQSTTLTKTRTTVLDGSGNGLVVLSPDVGQNWAPLFVRVSTGSKATPVPYLALYHGSPGVQVQQSQFIDDTFTGSGDSSSMIAGTPVLYGEALLFQFQNGTPGDTAIATVFGQTSPLPPNLDLVPQVPGTHFSGHLTTEIIGTIAKSSGSNVIGPGGIQVGNVIDVRSFASYYLQLDALTTTSPSTGYNQIEVVLTWNTDAAASVRVYADDFKFWADAITGFGVSLGTVSAQDVMHGPYMRMNLFNAGSDSVSVTWNLLGTTRVLPGPYVRQGNFPDGVLASEQDTIPVGGEFVIPCPLAYGNSQLFVFNHGAAAMSAKLDYGLPGDDTVIQTIAPNTLVSQNFVIPKRGALIAIDGTSGQMFDTRFITQYNKS